MEEEEEDAQVRVLWVCVRVFVCLLPEYYLSRVAVQTVRVRLQKEEVQKCLKTWSDSE